MDREKHSARTQEALGRPWPEVHDYLDQYAPLMPARLAHRVLLHHALGVEKCVAEFGEDARPAAELHIRDDFGGEIPATPQAVTDRMEIWQSDLGLINRTLKALGWTEISLRQQRAKERRKHKTMLAQAQNAWMKKNKD